MTFCPDCALWHDLSGDCVMRRPFWFRVRRFFHAPRYTPHRVHIEWQNLPAHKQWPDRLELPNVPRCVEGRKVISGLLGTRNWIWVGKNRIRAWFRPRVGPKGGTGTAPIRTCDVALCECRQVVPSRCK